MLALGILGRRWGWLRGRESEDGDVDGDAGAGLVIVVCKHRNLFVAGIVVARATVAGRRQPASVAGDGIDGGLSISSCVCVCLVAGDVCVMLRADVNANVSGGGGVVMPGPEVRWDDFKVSAPPRVGPRGVGEGSLEHCLLGVR